MRLIIARLRACVRTQLGVLRDQLRVLSLRKCADFHKNRLIYAYLSTWESLPRRSATARAAWNEKTMPLRSSRTANELQHATRWQPSVLAQCKRGLNLLDHTNLVSNCPLGQSLVLG